jgi:hypothetical protein
MIQAKVIADSLSPQGHRLTTLEVVMPRYILAEFNTHRVLSKNSASSRAIPFNKMVKNVKENPFIPIAWQKDHKGMQGTEYFQSENGDNSHKLIEGWLAARDSAIQIAEGLHNSDVTKQLCNRLLEPFMWHTTLVTATEFENFFELRLPIFKTSFGEIFRSKKEYMKHIPHNDSDYSDIRFWNSINESQAEIHIQDLAEKMYDLLNENKPKELKEGESIKK